ncbi:related to NADPH:adrenodoxin oxidoreductase precursor, mitochondrial [Cephalotrichum gorgonifer]|uniref:NADPH:adrenodoxin oxidoreductase, mitochondrial n=1 Tax=Cephalotrichum gorgonifer TaxID=2041049 RepID=A0AAE8N066_9PEZI|nr:related to NADPH:adrenodoxin oxidoreductase precursor, mitochondrial [Cephalotrichum gorgonifer]
MAIIGSGPAGFYTAYRLMARIPQAQIDMYEARPVPYGLVRFGVAPDHPEVKNCQDKFEEVASSPNFTFLGNVSIGDTQALPGNCKVDLDSILRHYNAVTFAYGAAEDRTLGIPGESLKGIYSARQFVGWYNGLPEYSGLDPDLESGDTATIIGQGNVALDVARILLSDVDVLRKTDITEEATERLSRSRIRRVRVVGRRGPMQAAFTIKEARELLKLPGVGFHPVAPGLIPDDVSGLPRPTKRLMALLQTGSAAKVRESERSWSLDFCLSPKEFIADQSRPSHVGGTLFERTALSAVMDPHAKATGTGDHVSHDSSLIFRSIGYKSVPLDGFENAGIPFDTSRGILHNDGLGRVVQDRGTRPPVPGVYCAGWVKRGPTGVIASTMQDAFATADTIAADVQKGAALLNRDADEVRHGWGGVEADTPSSQLSRVVSWKDWQLIDQAEKARGKLARKERIKFTSTADMLALLG